MAERILMAVKSEPDVILYRGNYPGWPWLTAAGDRLLCAFRDDGVHGFSATGKVLWGSGDAIASFAPKNGLSGGAGAVYLSDYEGTLHAFGFPMEH